MEEITEPSDTATNQDGDVRKKVATHGDGPFLTDEATRNEGPEDGGSAHAKLQMMSYYYI